MNYSNQTAGAVPVRETQVQGQLARLEHALDDLDKSFSTLADRVQEITRTEPPSAEKDGPRPVETLVPLADRIRKAADRVVSMSAYVTNVVVRVEL